MPQRKLGLLIEDDRELCLTIQKSLSSYRILPFFDIPSIADSSFKDASFVLLDEQLPSGSGFEFAQALKKTFPHLTIIFITANATKTLILNCLNLGVTKFLEKPFKLETLQQALAELTSKEETLYQSGGVALKLDSKVLEIDGKPVPLTATEYRLIETLIRNSGSCVTKEQLHNMLWNHSSVSANTLDTHLSNLRKKNKTIEARLRNVRSRGYIWDNV